MRTISVLSVAIVLLTAVVGVTGEIESAKTPKILSLTIDGTIHSGTVTILDKALQKVSSEGFEALLIELDTPGGLVSSTRDIVKLMLNASSPVFVYVSPSGARAGSAGTFITLAGHIAAMAPGTNMGAAHPVMITGKDPEQDGSEHMAKKIENDTAAFIETIALRRGRNAEWARKAVIESDSITEVKALELDVIDVVAKDVHDLYTQIHGKSVEVNGKTVTLSTEGAVTQPFEIELKLQVLNYLANPEIVFLLLLIAGLGIYMEISNPGMIIPAIISGLAIILLLIATQALPINSLGILLIFTAVALFILEIYVTSFGLLTIAACVAFFFGSLLLFDPNETDLSVPRGYIIAATISFALVAIFVGIAMTRSFQRPVTTGMDALIGRCALASEDIVLGAQGRIFIDGEYWNAMSADPIHRGEKVEILKASGLLLTVRKA